MKVWLNYGSEHSANLVMIGKFENVQDANQANELIEKLIEQVRKDEQNGLIDPQGDTNRFSEPMQRLLSDASLYTLGPSELQQFNYDFNLDVRGSQIVVKTDEIDVSAILKVFILKGGRVEVYSAHDHPKEKDSSKE
jgi:hypothetical protein